jgi:hypothetical protein
MSELFNNPVVKVQEIEQPIINDVKQDSINKNNIREYIKDNKLIAFDDLLILSNHRQYKSERIEVYTKIIGDDIIIVRDNLYMYDEELKIYLKSSIEPIEFLTLYLLILKEKSHSILSDKDKTKIHQSSISTYESIKDINLLINYMRKSDDYFDDPKLDEIHFKNCYISLRDGNKYIRTKLNKCCYCINKDYNEPSSEALNYVISIINKIYPNEADRNAILSIYGNAFTGRSTKKHESLFLLGQGSAGKSTLLEMFKIAFEDYVMQLKEDTLSINNQKQDRILNMFMYKKFIRLCYINELAGKINDSVFKQLIEGKIQTTTLFQEGMNDIIHNAYMVFMSNKMPDIKFDSGIERRIVGLTHMSSFVKDETMINESKHIYLKDTSLLDQFKGNIDLQNALIYIICAYSKEIYEGKSYPITENMIDTKESIKDANDIIDKFIEMCIIKTNSEKDKLRLDDLYNYFKKVNHKSLIKEQQFKDGLKDKGIIYDRQVSFTIGKKQIKGGYRGLKLNKIDYFDDSDNEYNTLDKDIEEDDENFNYEKLYKEMLEQNKALIEQNNALIEQNSELKQASSNIKQISYDDEFAQFIEKQKRFVNKYNKSKSNEIKQGSATSTLREQVSQPSKSKKFIVDFSDDVNEFNTLFQNSK